MRRCIGVVLLALVLIMPLSADPLQSYVPYEEGEFPLWTYSLRRAEKVFFGSMLLTIPVGMLSYSLAQRAGWVKPGTSELSSYLVPLAIASTLSLGVAVADYILGTVE
jgi:glycopeptide antibiotics resistance protein